MFFQERQVLIYRYFAFYRTGTVCLASDYDPNVLSKML
ncbi:hypothetical protein NSB1T_10245 [Coprobacter fastidiosus NSB1 = JCM 33896]|nr:hypothetical protein NSB1T_10245 [Coprobacter fastidiosus NSB1 = JCM 33896]